MSEKKANPEEAQEKKMFVFRPEALVPENDENKSPTDVLEEQRESFKRWEEEQAKAKEGEVTEADVDQEVKAVMSDVNANASETGKTAKEVVESKQEEEKIQQTLRNNIRAQKEKQAQAQKAKESK